MIHKSITAATSDDRGQIADILYKSTFQHAAIIESKGGGIIRGNHYHKHTTQWNYVLSGRIKLLSQDPGGPVVETLMQPGDFAATGPNVRHALVGVDEASVLVFTKGPRGGKEYESDTFRLEQPLQAA